MKESCNLPQHPLQEQIENPNMCTIVKHLMPEAQTASYDLTSAGTHKSAVEQFPDSSKFYVSDGSGISRVLTFWTLRESGAAGGHAIRNPRIIHNSLLSN